MDKPVYKEKTGKGDIQIQAKVSMENLVEKGLTAGSIMVVLRNKAGEVLLKGEKTGYGFGAVDCV